MAVLMTTYVVFVQRPSALQPAYQFIPAQQARDSVQGIQLPQLLAQLSVGLQQHTACNVSDPNARKTEAQGVEHRFTECPTNS